MKKSKLKNMNLTSVDLCKRGANPYANIKLFKSTDHEKGGEDDMEKSKERFFTRLGKSMAKIMGTDDEEVLKEAFLYGEMESFRRCTDEVYRTTYALQESLISIVRDNELDEEGKSEMMTNTLNSFVADVTKNITEWSKVKSVKKSEEEDFEDISDDEEIGKNECKKSMEGTENMSVINVEKMSAEDRAILEALEKKYVPAEESEDYEREMHPEVKKALDEMEGLKVETEKLRKSLEIKELEEVAKKYEVLGKSPAELAEKLYDLKKSGDGVYNDYVALLDEQVTLANNGIFKEIGSNRSGGGTDLNGIVAEIMKSEPTMTRAQAVVKAFETNPNLDPFTGQAK